MKSQSPVQHEVNIDGKEYVVTVVQTGKSTWRAWGDSWGRHIVETGSSEHSALSQWKQKAKVINWCRVNFEGIIPSNNRGGFYVWLG